MQCRGGPPDGRQVLGNVPCLRNHAMMIDAVVMNCDGRQLLCIVPCLRSHAVMDDKCSAGGGEPPDGRQVLGDVPCGRLHLHQVHTGQPKHRLVCFYLLLVLHITYDGLETRQEHEAIIDISSSSCSCTKASCPAAGPVLARLMRCCLDTHASSSQCIDDSVCHKCKHTCHYCCLAKECKSSRMLLCC